VIHKFDAPPTRIEPWPSAPRITNDQSTIVNPAEPSAIDPRLSAVAAPALFPTLLNLPIQKCWPLDGGRFITLPCVLTQDPDTSERNVGIYRIQIYDDRAVEIDWQIAESP